MKSQPPAGSTIVVETDGESTLYRWSAASRHPIQWLIVPFGGLMLVGGLFMPVAFITAGGPEVHLPLPIALGFAMVMLCIGGLLLYSGLYRRGHESLRLSREAVEYDTGPTILPLPLMLWFSPMLRCNPQVFGTASMPHLHIIRKRYNFNPELLGPFTLERVGDRQRLRVDNGADRVEFGTLLREPEREWLAEQITQWQKSYNGDVQ